MSNKLPLCVFLLAISTLFLVGGTSKATKTIVGTAVSLKSAIDSNTVLPDKFIGVFDLDYSENFDEYLIAKGYDWVTRAFVNLATVKKIFTKTRTKYLFDYSNLTSKKDVFYKRIRLGRKFIGEGMDGTKQEITFFLKKNVLFEHHKAIGKGEIGDETYEYHIDGDYLVQKMSHDGVEGRRFFKRV